MLLYLLMSTMSNQLPASTGVDVYTMSTMSTMSTQLPASTMSTMSTISTQLPTSTGLLTRDQQTKLNSSIDKLLLHCILGTLDANTFSENLTDLPKHAKVHLRTINEQLVTHCSGKQNPDSITIYTLDLNGDLIKYAQWDEVVQSWHKFVK